MGWEDIPKTEYVWILFCWISFFLYLVIIRTILKNRSKGFKNLGGPYFNIFLGQAINELLMFLTINLINRPRKYRLIPYWHQVSDSDLIKWMYFWQTWLKDNLYFGHVLIAVDRLTIFLIPFRYRQVWTPKNIVIYMMLGYALTATLRLFIFDGPYTFSLIGDRTLSPYMSREFMQRDATLDITNCISCAVIAAVMYSIAIYLVRKSTDSTMKTKREIALLRCAILIFLVFLPSVIKSSVHLYGSLTDNKELVTKAVKFWAITTELMCISQPWIMLFTCHPIREGLSTVRSVQDQNTISLEGISPTWATVRNIRNQRRSS